MTIYSNIEYYIIVYNICIYAYQIYFNAKVLSENLAIMYQASCSLAGADGDT